MRQANKLNCEFVAILGENELNNNQIQLKNMQQSTQEIVELKKIVDVLNSKIL